MSHFCLLRNGMSNAAEANLNNIAVAFVSSAGGVVGANDYLVANQNSAAFGSQTADSMFLKVNVGRAYVPNLGVSAPMQYASYNNAVDTTSILIANNTTGSTQQDYIVLYVNLAASVDANADNVMAWADARGTGGAPPTNNQILNGNGGTWAGIGANNPYIILAQVSVANNATSIGSGAITDKRTFASFQTGQTVPVPQYINFTDQGSAPSAPSAGFTLLYAQKPTNASGEGLYSLINGGTPAQIGSDNIIANGTVTTNQNVNWASGNTQSYTLGANITFSAFQNPTVGQHLTLILTQDATGSRTVTWPASVIWPNNVAPTLTTTASNTDMVGFIWDGTYYRGFISTAYPH